MFKKILIAEDHEIANISVQKTLHDLGIQDAKYVYYCDDALNWIKKAAHEGEPYDLLITDLIFEDDHTPQQIKGGAELVRAVKQIQPDIKIIVLSLESRASIIDELFKHDTVDGYVRKARRDAQHLKEALQTVYNNRTYYSPQVKESLKEKHSHEFTAFDIFIISLLAEGVPQKNIPSYLEEKNMKPSGLSSVEKRLGLMRTVLGFSKNEQLVAYCKDVGII